MVHAPNEAHLAKTTLFKPFILAASQLVIFIGFDEHIFVLNIIFFSLLVYNRLKLKFFKKHSVLRCRFYGLINDMADLFQRRRQFIIPTLSLVELLKQLLTFPVRQHLQGVEKFSDGRMRRRDFM